MSIKNMMRSFVMILVLLNASTALAAVAVTKDTSQRGQGVTSQNQMRRLTGFMKKMENNVLYLEDNSRYNLAGVVIITRPRDPNEQAAAGKKTVVEMIFLQSQLKQVVIHQ
jgi:hypothetical protein